MKRILRWMTGFILVVALGMVANSAYASLCVWVNPDRDIRNFFPEANSYITEVKKYTKEQEAAIEKRVEAPLDP